ncbi:hypothetical protein H9P43_004378 [Blastocladiella emersonii ATCC 22665]|nr:hypothetical protein H9P43_004378 [Blastocladiella emersonii ATCC 22665]
MPSPALRRPRSAKVADEGDVEIVFRHREIPQVTNALQEAMRAMFQHQFQTQ